MQWELTGEKATFKFSLVSQGMHTQPYPSMQLSTSVSKMKTGMGGTGGS